MGRVAQSVQRLTTGWTVRGSNPGGARFSTHPDRPWGPPSLLYNAYRVFHGAKIGQGVLLTTHRLLVPRSWKSRAIPLPTLWDTTGPVTGTLYPCPSLYILNSVGGREQPWCTPLLISTSFESLLLNFYQYFILCMNIHYCL